MPLLPRWLRHCVIYYIQCMYQPLGRGRDPNVPPSPSLLNYGYEFISFHYICEYIEDYRICLISHRSRLVASHNSIGELN